MRSSSRRAVAVTAVLLAATLTACAPAGDGRPDPTDVVAEYLDAIAAGDAETAAAMDSAAVDEDDPLVDAETLRTNAVLEGAQRIENVQVDSETTSGSPEGARLVSFSFELAGKSYEDSLNVSWNEDDSEWEILDTFAQKLLVQAQVTRTQAALIGFSVPGASVPAPADQGDAPVAWLTYPGVYTLTGDIDPALLVDPASGVEREVVIDSGAVQPSVIFEVTALP